MSQNYYRLITLLGEIGAKVLRKYLEHHSGYNTLPDLLNKEKHRLYHSWFPHDNGNCCCSPKVKVGRSNITKAQFEMMLDKETLTPPCSNLGAHHCWFKAKPAINYDILDITLLRLLIVNIVTTLSTADRASLDTIRELRNYLAHLAEIRISDSTEFELKWCAAKVNLLNLSITVSRQFSNDIEQDIDGLKTKSLDDNECKRMLEIVKHFKETDRVLEDFSVTLHSIDHKVDQMSDTAKKISREPRLERLIENTKTMLKTHQKDLYVPGSWAEIAAYARLSKEHFITIAGRGGQGKTTLGKHLMHKVCNEGLGSQEKYTPAILDKAEDFDLIDSKDHLIILIDDPFGKSNIDKASLEEWERRFDKMLSFIKEGNIYIIMAIRSSILKDCSDTVVQNDLLKDDGRIDLSSDSFRLSQNEKYVMLKAYCEKYNVQICMQDQHVLPHASSYSPERPEVKESPFKTKNTRIHNTTLYQISRSDPFLGFPQSCYIFFTNKMWKFDEPLDFFKHPDDHLQKDVYNMKESASVQYITLVYMLLEGGEVDLNKLNEKKLEKLYELTKMQPVDIEEIKECFLYKVSGVYIQKLEGKSVYSKGSQHLAYRFSHETILETVLLSFCKRYPEVFLELGKKKQISEFARPKEYKRKPGEVCVNLPTRCHRKLAEQFVQKYSGDAVHVLFFALVNNRLYTDRAFTNDVFALMDADYGSIIRGTGDLWHIPYPEIQIHANKCDTDLFHFIIDFCKRYAIYRPVPQEESFTTKQSPPKLKLAVFGFIDILNYILNLGETNVVDSLLDLSELSLHLRYETVGLNGSDDYMSTCAIDRQVSHPSLFVLGLSWFFSFENPVCYACIRKYKNLAIKLLDRMTIENLNLGIKRLIYILIEINWPNVLQRLVDKKKDALQQIGMSKLILHAAKCKSKSSVLYLLELEADLAVADNYGRTLLNYCCTNDWVDVFTMVLKKDKDVLSKQEISPSLLILLAASYKKKQMVSHLLQYDVDFTTRDKHGKTLLHFCCEYGWIDIIATTVKKEKIVLTKPGLSPNLLILHAASYKNKQMVSHLLQHDVDFSARDKDVKTLLRYCCEYGWIDIFNMILAKDQDVLAKPGLSPSLLILHAGSHKSIQMVLHLLRYDVDISLCDKDGKTLLHYCCEYDWVETFEMLLQKDKDVIMKPNLSLSLLIIHAASHSGTQMVSHLLQYDIDFTVCDKNGKTLLHYCCKNNYVCIFDMILKKDKNVLAKQGLSASLLILYTAVHGTRWFPPWFQKRENLEKKRSTEMLSHLLQYDVDFTVKDKDGKTFLHYCCEYGWLDIFNIILKTNENVLAISGLSPSLLILHAASHRNKEVVLRLLRYDVDFAVRDEFGNTLLHYCCSFGWKQIVLHIITANQRIVNEKNNLGELPIFLVIRNDREETLSFEAERIDNDRREIIGLLLQNGVEISSQDNKGNTLLHYCVAGEMVVIIKQHLTDPSLLSCNNADGILPLHTAFLFVNSNVIEALLGANVITEKERNACCKILCLGILIKACSSYLTVHKGESSLSSEENDLIKKMIEHHSDFVDYERTTNIDYYEINNQFLRQHREFANGFFEPLTTDDHAYTIIHLLFICGSNENEECNLIDFFKDNYKQALHVRNTTQLPTALHLAAYLGRERSFIKLYRAGVRCSDGDLSVVDTVKRGKQHHALIGQNANIWSHNIDQCILEKSLLCGEPYFLDKHDEILDFCSMFSIDT